jgi:hypothetical protein
MYPFRIMAHTNTHNVHLECTLCVFCVGHDTQGVHYVYFVWAMTLKVYIMCILYGPWLSRCTICVFCMGDDPEGYKIHIMYTFRVMAHTNTHNVHIESHGPYKLHIMYTFRVIAHAKDTYCTPWESWSIQNTHNVHLESHGPCMDHETQGVHYVYFVETMTLKVYIMCILCGP